MQGMGVLEHQPRGEAAQREVEAVVARAGQQHHQRPDDDPADDERHGDAHEAVPRRAAQAVARDQQRGEEAGHGVEDRHPEDVDDADRPVEHARLLGLLPRPAAVRRIGDDGVEVDAEEHHRGAQAVEGVVAHRGLRRVDRAGHRP
jgi:hypothetical protein